MKWKAIHPCPDDPRAFLLVEDTEAMDDVACPNSSGDVLLAPPEIQNLLAAAPDLLEALKVLVAEDRDESRSLAAHGGHGSSAPWYVMHTAKAVQDGEAAIAKAEGREVPK